MNPHLRKRELALVTLIALLILVPGLSRPTLIDPWETHYAEVARRILADRDWIKLSWENEAFRSKPALTPWLIAASLRAHGLAEDGGFSGEMISTNTIIWAVRLPFALFGAAGLVLLWWMLAQLVSRRVAWLAFAINATMPFYALVARQAITDMPMVATAVGALACFLLAIHSGDRSLRPRWGPFTASSATCST